MIKTVDQKQVNQQYHLSVFLKKMLQQNPLWNCIIILKEFVITR